MDSGLGCQMREHGAYSNLLNELIMEDAQWEGIVNMTLNLPQTALH